MRVVALVEALREFHKQPHAALHVLEVHDLAWRVHVAEWVLGYAPRYSNKDALLRNYAWYLENLPRFAHTSGVSHRVPWKQGALGLIKALF